MQVKVEGLGEVDVICSPYTLKIYEQAFHSSLIGDVFGKIDLAADSDNKEYVTAAFVKSRLRKALGEGKRLPNGMGALVDRAFPVEVTTKVDYTREHWDADLRAFWSMLKTAEKKKELQGAIVTRPTPGYDEWLLSLDAINMNQVADAVARECSDKIFRA